MKASPLLRLLAGLTFPLGAALALYPFFMEIGRDAGYGMILGGVAVAAMGPWAFLFLYKGLRSKGLVE